MEHSQAFLRGRAIAFCALTSFLVDQHRELLTLRNLGATSFVAFIWAVLLVVFLSLQWTDLGNTARACPAPIIPSPVLTSPCVQAPLLLAS